MCTVGIEVQRAKRGPKGRERRCGSWGHILGIFTDYSPENIPIDATRIIFLHKKISNSRRPNGQKTLFLRCNICSKFCVVSMSLASRVLRTGILRLCSLHHLQGFWGKPEPLVTQGPPEADNILRLEQSIKMFSNLGSASFPNNCRIGLSGV